MRGWVGANLRRWIVEGMDELVRESPGRALLDWARPLAEDW
jgi:hypothetical protein